MITKIKPAWWLLIGVVTVTAAHMTVRIDLLGWIAYTPFLVFLRLTKGIKSRLVFLLVLIIAWSFCIAKIVTPPMPFAMIFLFSVPISLFHLPGFLVWDKFKDRPWSVFLFLATISIMEWIQYTFTPFASWGVAAYSQLNSIAILQSLSLFGMAGLSFMLYWTNIAVAEIITQRKIPMTSFQFPLAIFLSLIVFGSLRYNLSKAKGVETIKVAAIGTDSEVGGFPLPSEEVNNSVKRNLFRRTELAAGSSAKLVVWNEASTFIMPEEEKDWNDSLSGLSKRLGIYLVAAYVVPTSEKPLRYKNKYLFLKPDGSVAYVYNKHQPVPGEPADKGVEPLAVVEIEGSKTGAVICYDYDFPYLAKGYGKLDADIVADPSSDWRGIDPIHSQMAAYRAVEQGHSIVRSTRFGLSAAITPYGEMAAQMSSFDSNDKIMIAQIPKNRVTTVYAIIGDTFVYLCMAFIILFIFKVPPFKPI